MKVDWSQYEYYKGFSKEGSKIGKLMLIQQGIFQFGSIAAVAILLIIFALAAVFRQGEYTSDVYMGVLEDSAMVKFCVYLGSAIMQLVAGICFLVFYMQNKEVIRNAPLEGRHTSLKYILKGWLYIESVFVILSGMKFFLCLVTHHDPTDAMLSGAKYKVATFLVISVFPAIVEELFFRGVLFRYLRRHGFYYAAIVSAVLFGLMHMNFSQILFTIPLGLVLCYVYEKTGHIWPCMLLHFLHNGTVALLTLAEDQSFMTIPFIWLGLNAAVGLGILLPLEISPRVNVDKTAVKKTLTAIPMMVLIIIAVIVCIIRFLFS